MTLEGITIDPRSATPPFEQLRQGVLAGIADGSLAAGSRLPTVRALAEQLGLAANTVARSYRELEAAGAVETRGRNGTFIALSADAAAHAAQEAAADYAARIRSLGISLESALAYVDAALRD
ncbi:GntR family transcriptional regulator [Lysinimonas soli]|uniref:GntR family transcriptional regulator n=1 Tax=Lysinimonas soli TaxID=1074233 RepID=A0ABW0NP44_9MICO